MKGIRREHFAILGMHAASNCNRSASSEPGGHHYSFRSGGRAIVHGGIRYLHAGKLADHGLKFKDGLQRALRNLRLVRRVGRKKLAARNERVNDDWAIVIVGASAEKTGMVLAVFPRALPEPVNDFRFRHLP